MPETVLAILFADLDQSRGSRGRALRWRRHRQANIMQLPDESSLQALLARLRGAISTIFLRL